MKPQTDMHETENIPWTEIPATDSGSKGQGVTEKILSRDPDNPDNCTRLLKMEKGYRSQGPLTHPHFWEEVLVLEGTLIDERNNITAGPGWYCCRYPGMPHGPFYTPTGVTTMEIHYMPKES
jgi:hypothetical protein